MLYMKIRFTNHGVLTAWDITLLLIMVCEKEAMVRLTDQFRLETVGLNSKQVHIAAKISEIVSQYPYYAQLLAYSIFEISAETVTESDVEKGFEKLLASERYGYEGLIQTLTGPQTALLRALASHPTAQIHSTEYMSRHNLSIGGIQSARKKLEALDLIEKHAGVWRVVDPIFGAWLTGYYY